MPQYVGQLTEVPYGVAYHHSETECKIKAKNLNYQIFRQKVT